MNRLTQVANRLQLAHRYGRNRTVSGHPSLAEQATAFVLALGQQHAGRLDKRPFIGFIFRQMQPAGLLHTQQTYIHLAPRLSFKVLAWPTARPPVSNRSAPPAPVTRLPSPRQAITVLQQGQRTVIHAAKRPSAAGHPPPITTVLHRPGREHWRAHRQIEATVHHLQTRHQVRIKTTEQSVQRFVHRGERVELVSNPRRPFAAAARQPEAGPGPLPGTPEPAPGRPVPRIVRRPAVITREQTPKTAVAAPSFNPAAPSINNSTARQVAAAPPVDVNMLTNQVVRLIDQRINANRERMGRL